MGCEDGSCCASKNATPGAIEFPGTDDHDTPWKFYNHLIAGIPEDVRVTSCCMGTTWNYVEAESGMGISYADKGGARRMFAQNFNGLTLREVATLSKSWNFAEASLGVAALNAWYSQPALVDGLGAVWDKSDETGHKEDAFSTLRDAYTGKSVTVIGHFPHVERIAEVASRLTVLERNCTSELDTPDPACEYVLPSSDYVFITGVTIINKTAPRLFTLAKDATTVLVGPSVVPAEFLFRWDVDIIAGSVVVDPELTRRLVEQGAGMLFGQAVKMMTLTRPSAL